MRLVGVGGLLVCVGLLGCSSNEDPASYVTGLRVLAIVAEPPDVAPGSNSQISALALDTAGDTIQIAWQSCVDTPLAAAEINPACVTNQTASYLAAVGQGLSFNVTMPANVPTSQLGRPDTSGGVYLPLIGRATAGTDSLVAAYLLRINQGLPPNHNPSFTGVFEVEGGPGDGGAGAGLTEVVAGAPPTVHAGDEITLRAAFAPGSAETYQIYDGNPKTTTPRTVTEHLTVSWFSTAGTFASAASGVDVPDTVLHLDQGKNGPTVHLPPSGTAIDLWAVGRDERGGATTIHRQVMFE